MSHDLLVALDPGINCAGLAVFSGDLLIDAWSVKLRSSETPLTKAVQMAQLCSRQLGPVLTTADRFVAEWPVIVKPGRASRSRRAADPNDMLPLAALCGALAARAPGAVIESVKPEDWKGATSKPKKKSDSYIVESQVRDRLRPAELAVLRPDLTWDGFDAIGLGLWALGRFERRRALRGAE